MPMFPNPVTMTTMNRPIRHCYWVEPGKLLAGEYPGDKQDELAHEKISALLRSGVVTFIDLTEENEGLQPYAPLLNGAASHHRFGLRDVSVPESPEATMEVLDAIDRHIALGHLVYVHCWGGVGRTGVVVGCWLARQGLGGEKALARLRDLWRHCPKSAWRKSPETLEQEQYIVNWEAGR